MSESAMSYKSFLLARTVSEKFTCLVTNAGLQSTGDAAPELRQLLTSLRGSSLLTFGDIDLVKWNEHIRRRLSSLVTEMNHAELAEIVNDLELAGVKLQVADPPRLLLRYLSGDVFSAMQEWAMADRLARGAERFLGIVTTWIEALSNDRRNEFTVEPVDSPEWDLFLRGHSGIDLGVAPPIQSVQKLGDEPSNVVYMRQCVDTLVNNNESLAAAALLAGVAYGMPDDFYSLRWELNGLACHYLNQHIGQDTSRALLVQAGSRALYEEGGQHHKMVIGNLDSAIGECKAIANAALFRGKVSFKRFCAELHLDRAVWRLGAAEDGHWLAIEDYAVSRSLREEILADVEPNFRQSDLHSYAHLLLIAFVAKEKANVYLDAELRDDLDLIISIAEEVGDPILLRNGLERRANFFSTQISRELTLLAVQDLERALEIESDDHRSSISINQSLGVCLTATGENLKRAHECLDLALVGHQEILEATATPSEDEVANLAICWSNMGSLRAIDPDESIERTYEAYEKSAKICQDFLGQLDSDELRHQFASAQLQLAPYYLLDNTDARWQQALNATTNAINALTPKYSDNKRECSTDWIDDIASAHYHRSIIWKMRGQVYRNRWEDDLNQAIAIRYEIVERVNKLQEAEALNRLSSLILQRSLFDGEHTLNSDQAANLLRDCDAVEELLCRIPTARHCDSVYLQIWFDLNKARAQALDVLSDSSSALQASMHAASALKRLPEDTWTSNRRFRFELSHAKRLASSARYEEALYTLEMSTAKLNQLVGSTISRRGKKEMIREYMELGALGAWVLCRLDRPSAALTFVEENRGFFFREALLTEERVLIPRVGIKMASEIAAAARTLDELQLRQAANELDDVLRQQLSAASCTLNELTQAAQMESKVLSLQQLASHVPNPGILIIPASSSLGTTVFMITNETSKDSLRVIDLPGLTTNTLKSWVRRFKTAEFNLVVEGNQANAIEKFESELLSLSDVLWRRFVEPILAEAMDAFGSLAKCPLTIATQGPLDAMPLHIASRIDNGRRRYVIEDHVIRYTPGVVALELMRHNAPRTSQKSLVGFVNPTGDLPSAEQYEWPAIASQSWPTSPKAFVGPKVGTRKAFNSIVDEGNVTHLHLSMHSIFVPGAPERSGLILADSILTVADILALRKFEHLEFVCMPTCQSSRTDAENGGDEFIGLVSAFIEAGASEVLGALYPIQDRNSDLIGKVYEHLLTGACDLGEAFQLAVMSLLELEEISVSQWAAYKPVCAGTGESAQS